MAVVSLALGVGANVTLFSVVREMVLDDVSARDPGRLSRVEGVESSYARYRELRASGAFEDLAYYRGFADRVWRHQTVWRLATSANFFDVLGVRAFAGRLYGQADEGRALAVASYGFWRRRLDGDPRTLGRTIEVDGQVYTLAGVLPPDYRSIYGHGVAPELYLEDSPPKGPLAGLFGRLRRGATIEQTRAAFALAAAERSVALRPMAGFRANAAKAGDDRLFWLFFVALEGLAAMLAAIACANVAGLLTVRALDRRRELAIRKALGATRLQLLRPLLAEGAVLVACGTALGLAVDSLLRSRLAEVRWPSAYGIPIEFHLQADGGLLLYAGIVAVAALLVSTVLPAVGSANPDLAAAIRRTEPALSLRRWDLRSGFAVVQMVLSLVLVLVASLFVRSLAQITAAGPGFDAVHTLIAAVHPLPGWKGDLRRRAIERAESVPGVEAVTSTGLLPLMGEVPEVATPQPAYVVGVGDRYFTTLRIPILRGRDFLLEDRGRKPEPAIVNRTLALERFGGIDPVGRSLKVGTEVVEIVGVAADFQMRTLGETERPAVFRPDFNAQLLVRVAGPAGRWIEPLRQALDGVEGAAAIDIRPLQDAVAGAAFPLRAAAWFLAALAGLGLALALVGLFGCVSYAVGRRTREFGIRGALGSSRARIAWTALRDGAAVLLCGVAIGMPLAAAAIRPLADLFPAGFHAWAPAPLAGAVLALLVAGAAAIALPARRAAGVDPAIALRQE